eukprot:COSAG01_NODE_12176_length_1786_cov_1.698874_1_plen_156_part_00
MQTCADRSPKGITAGNIFALGWAFSTLPEIPGMCKEQLLLDGGWIDACIDLLQAYEELGSRRSSEAADSIDGGINPQVLLAAVLTEIHLCGVCSCQEILRRNGGRGQARWGARARAIRPGCRRSTAGASCCRVRVCRGRGRPQLTSTQAHARPFH